MSAFVALLGVTLTAGAVLGGPRGPSPEQAEKLVTAAQASGRPPECRSGTGASSRASRLTIWDRARQPHLQRYCDLLGRAQAKLDASPAAAREAARLADKVLPGKASPWVLIGRAHVRLQDFPRALNDFQKARSLDPRSVEDPAALHDLAIAQRKAGKLHDAMTTYRILVPRLGLLPTTDDRIAVLIEAAALAMSRGPSGLEEASALLGEARAQPLSTHDPLTLGLLALVLDRGGKTQEAEAVLDEIHRAHLAGTLMSRTNAPHDMLVHPAEWDALIALVLEREDRARAIAAWRRYLDAQPDPVFEKHAAQHLEALQRAPGRPRLR